MIIFFTRDYGETLFYTNYNNSKNNYLKGIEAIISIFIHLGQSKFACHSWRGISNYQNNFIIKEVEKDHVLTKVDKLEDKNLKIR